MILIETQVWPVTYNGNLDNLYGYGALQCCSGRNGCTATRRGTATEPAGQMTVKLDSCPTKEASKPAAKNFLQQHARFDQFTIAPSPSRDVGASASGLKRSISLRPWLAKGSASNRSKNAYGWSDICSTVCVTSMTRHAGSNVRRTPSSRSCHPSHRNRQMKGWWARSDSNRGPRDSLLPRRFRREWTISSPLKGAGRSSLLLSATQTHSGSLCTFRRCTAGLAQGCQQPSLLRFP